MNIAKDFDEFTHKAVTATVNALNSESGQALIDELRKKCLKDNPNMSEDEWSKIKQEFLVYMFFNLIKDAPDLMREMGEHLYKKLNSDEK